MSKKKKSGKLTKVEKFYIENNLDKDIADISNDLNRTESAVNKYIDSIEEEKDTGHIASSKQDSDVSNLMGYNDRGSTVMTPAASERSDDTRTTRVNTGKYEGIIHTIKEK
tara:strand:+ start:1639 stop:1971 length:333 start_codon:yes stop_codon:yes gene_type:complete